MEDYLFDPDLLEEDDFLNLDENPFLDQDDPNLIYVTPPGRVAPQNREVILEDLDLPEGHLSFLAPENSMRDSRNLEAILNLNEDDFLMTVDPDIAKEQVLILSRELDEEDVEFSDIEQPEVSPEKIEKDSYLFNAYGFPRSVRLANLILYMEIPPSPTIIFAEDFDEMFSFLGIYALKINKVEPVVKPTILKRRRVVEKPNDHYEELYATVQANNLLYLIPIWKNQILALIKIYDQLPRVDRSNPYYKNIKERQDMIFSRLVKEEKKQEYEMQDEAAAEDYILSIQPKRRRLTDLEIVERNRMLPFLKNALGIKRSKYIKQKLDQFNAPWRRFYIQDFEQMESLLEFYNKQTPMTKISIPVMTRTELSRSLDFTSARIDDKMKMIQLALDERTAFFDQLPSITPETSNVSQIKVQKRERLLFQLYNRSHLPTIQFTIRTFFERFIIARDRVQVNIQIHVSNYSYRKREYHNTTANYYIMTNNVNPFLQKSRIAPIELRNDILREDFKVKIPYSVIYDKDRIFRDRFTGLSIQRFWNGNDNFDDYDAGVSFMEMDLLAVKRSQRHDNLDPVAYKLTKEPQYKLLIFYKLTTPFDVVRNLVLNTSNMMTLTSVDAKIVTLEEYNRLYSEL